MSIDIRIDNKEKKPVIYKGQQNDIAITLTNTTNGDIPFIKDDTELVISIILEGAKKNDKIADFDIQFKDWNSSVEEDFILFNYTGAQAVWELNNQLIIDINKLQTSIVLEEEYTIRIQVSYENQNGDIITSLLDKSTSLIVSDPPIVGNADLSKVLNVFMENQGQIYVSPKKDSLSNAAFLVIKNVGKEAIFTGTARQIGAPKITVSFIYGNTIGCLAHDEWVDKESNGSAWKIKAGAPKGEGANVWRAEKYEPINSTVEQKNPKWRFIPEKGNIALFGTGKDSTVIFPFSDIISFTPPGHTQMVVRLSGFKKNDDIPYNDAIFVLDMVKTNAPLTRGVNTFFSASQSPTKPIISPNTPVAFNLKWTTSHVKAVKIITNFPNVDEKIKTYANKPALGYDDLTITIPNIKKSTAIPFTIQAYSIVDPEGNPDGLLNSLQYTSFVKSNLFIDDRDGKFYPTVQVNNRIWMAANLRYKPSNNSYKYGKVKQYGRLYKWPVAAPELNFDGWRLPNRADWEALLQTYSFDDFINLFKLEFNGRQDKNHNQSEFGRYAHYWTSTNNSGKVDYVSFSKRSKKTRYSTGKTALPTDYALSVRYVKDII